MSALVDTNILARSAEPRHPMHQGAAAAVALLRSQREVLCLAPQNLYEFWAVGTRPVSQNGLGLSLAEVEAHVAGLKKLFILLEETPLVFPEWERLVVQHQVVGKSAHDAHLVAIMSVHGIDRILTFNKADFQRYPQNVAVSPDEVLQTKTTP